MTLIEMISVCQSTDSGCFNELLASFVIKGNDMDHHHRTIDAPWRGQVLHTTLSIRYGTWLQFNRSVRFFSSLERFCFIILTGKNSIPLSFALKKNVEGF